MSEDGGIIKLSPLFAFGATLDNEYWKSIGFVINDDYEIVFEDLDVPGAKPSQRAVLELLADVCDLLINWQPASADLKSDAMVSVLRVIRNVHQIQFHGRNSAWQAVCDDRVCRPIHRQQLPNRCLRINPNVFENGLKPHEPQEGRQFL
jgi:hypothetical protein